MTNEIALKMLGEQLTKYFGSKDDVKKFSQECKDVGLNLREENIAINISENPEWFSVLLTYYELGLLSKISTAIKQIKQ